MKKTKPQYRGLIGAGLVLVSVLVCGVLLIHKLSSDEPSNGNPLAPLAAFFGLKSTGYTPAPITHPLPDYRSPAPAQSNSVTESPGTVSGLDFKKMFKSSEQIRLDASASAGALIGVPRVIDGDTLELAGQRVRLYGIDAPESIQLCLHRTGEWDCGRRAGLWLQQLIGGNEVACQPQGNDRYGRVVASCLMGETDIGGAMVKNGWAVAYRSITKTYVIAENDARRKRLGLWDSKFAMPWDFRHE